MSSEFVIAWISFFDNTLHQEKVYAGNRMMALHLAYERLTQVKYEGDDGENGQSIIEAAFDCDGAIEAIELL